MKNNILVTTTNTLDNAEIERYIDLLAVNVVVGTNFFSDFGASFTDLFGGNSNTYQNKLQQIYDTAIDKLTLKAAKIRANAIVGLKLDFDEISGKGKSMFMISATGTAVFVKYKKEDANSTENVEKVVSLNELENAITNLRLRKIFSTKDIPSDEQWEYLFNNTADEFIAPIVEKYLSLSSVEYKSDSQNVFLSNADQFFSIANKNILADILYGKLHEKLHTIFPIIKANKLFYPDKIIQLIKGGCLSEAIYCLPVSKEFYVKDDVVAMCDLLIMLNDLPNQGKIDMVKGMLSKTKEKFICSQGHTNDIEKEYCPLCGQNIKGLTQPQEEAISEYKDKVEILRTLFNN